MNGCGGHIGALMLMKMKEIRIRTEQVCHTKVMLLLVAVSWMLSFAPVSASPAPYES